MESLGDNPDSLKRAKKYGSTLVIYGSKISSKNFKRHFLLLSLRRVPLKVRRSAAECPSSNKREPIAVLPCSFKILFFLSVATHPHESVPISKPTI